MSLKNIIPSNFLNLIDFFKKKDYSIFMRFLLKFIFILFSFSSCAKATNVSFSNPLENQLENYCHTYLLNLSKRHNKPLTDKEVVITNVYDYSNFFINTLMFLERFVTPPKTRISYHYQCKFQINKNEKSHQGILDLILIRDQSHAEYTMWDDLQTTPGKILDDDKNIYYTVVKYLKIDTLSMWRGKNLENFFKNL